MANADVELRTIGPVRHIRLWFWFTGTVVAAMIVTPIVALNWTKAVVNQYDVQRRPAVDASTLVQSDPASMRFIDAYIDRERTAGRDIGLGQVRIATFELDASAGKIHLVWSGNRKPIKLLVASRTRLGVTATAIGITSTATLGTKGPLTPPVDRIALGGGRSDTVLKLYDSECIDVWRVKDTAAFRLSSCAEVWHSPKSIEWFYHHFTTIETTPHSDAHNSRTEATSEIAIRSRIVQGLRKNVQGPSFSTSCRNNIPAIVLGAVENIEGKPTNPALHVPPNPCAGYSDLTNQSQTQNGARLDSVGAETLSATSVYQATNMAVLPLWDDYVWVHFEICKDIPLVGCRRTRIDDGQYLQQMW